MTKNDLIDAIVAKYGFNLTHRLLSYLFNRTLEELHAILDGTKKIYFLKNRVLPSYVAEAFEDYSKGLCTKEEVSYRIYLPPERWLDKYRLWKGGR